MWLGSQHQHHFVLVVKECKKYSLTLNYEGAEYRGPDLETLISTMARASHVLLPTKAMMIVSPCELADPIMQDHSPCNRYIQSSQPSRQSVNSVRETSRAPTTSVDTTSRMTLQATKLGARLTGSMKLGWTPGGGAPAGSIDNGNGNICPSILKMNYSKKHPSWTKQWL